MLEPRQESSSRTLNDARKSVNRRYSGKYRRRPLAGDDSDRSWVREAIEEWDTEKKEEDDG